jgi:hypothetical protein
LGKFGKILGIKKPKTPQSVLDAERRAREAEEKSAKDAKQAEMDEEYRRTKQRGKVATILSSEGNSSSGTKTLLGG